MAIKRISIILYGLIISVSQLACQPGQDNGSGQSSEGMKLEINPPVEPVVCDPFSNDELVYRQNGLTGKFYYLTDDMPRYNRSSDYINHGVLVDRVTLFLSRLFVPTRAFDLGFTTQEGVTLKTNTGDTLYEYFGLQLESTLMLNASDTHIGDYQFAILSDDGATLSLQPDSNVPFQTLIENENDHPTRFQVATQAVHFDRTTRLPMKLQYYQGPRMHISMVLMWRPWPTNPADVMDPLNGYTTNTDFFDSTQVPSVPQSKYNELLGRGWKPLDTKNFLLREIENPCAVDDMF
ncbi:MAG: hypothetical protein AB7F59_03775 [Bdellovibrionales bacterium]